MSGGQLAISVIVAVRPGDEPGEALQGLQASRFDRSRFEILLARGIRPSRQRNLAASRARGRILYFLDDDSRPDPDALDRVESAFEMHGTAAVGGPSLCPSDATQLQHELASLMAHPLAFGSSSARYRQSGELRPSGEKELILCNLAVGRLEFQQLGGFNEGLYPNEENAFLDRLLSQGVRLLHDPQLVVRRYPRSTVVSYLKMLFTYGRGRGEQIRRHPAPGSLPNLAPALLALGLSLSLVAGWWYWAYPLGTAAASMLALAALAATQARRGAKGACRFALLLAAGHMCYGCGLWKGLVPGRTKAERLQESAEPVDIARIEPSVRWS